MHLVHGTKKGQRVKPNPPPPRCNIILLGAGGRLFPLVLSSSLRHPVPVVSHRLGGLLLLFPARYPVVSHRLGGTHTLTSAFYSTLLFPQREQLILCYCSHRSSSLRHCVGPCCMPLSCSSPCSHHVACVLQSSRNSCCRGTILPACRSSAM